MKRIAVFSLLLLAIGCSGEDRGEAAEGTAGEPTGSEGGESGGEESGGDDGQIFDVGDGMGTAGDGGEEEGCTKVDFLFVIDNSNSMFDNQQNLLNNYPAFMDSIEDTLDVQDFHVMVADTDTIVTCGDQCTYWNDDGPCVWYETPCATTKEQAEARTECDETLGAGVLIPMGPNTSSQICSFEGGNRYATQAEPDLNSAFECVAQVGTGGNGNEQQMESMLAAVSPELNAPGACNDGFLRDDALLVVTILTDESGDWAEDHDVGPWRDALVAAKGGNEDAVVVLGLLPDAQPNGTGLCKGENQAIATKFIEFVESLPNGSWASVCEEDYQPFFQSSVGVVETACDNFIPPG